MQVAMANTVVQRSRVETIILMFAILSSDTEVIAVYKEFGQRW